MEKVQQYSSLPALPEPTHLKAPTECRAHRALEKSWMFGVPVLRMSKGVLTQGGSTPDTRQLEVNKAFLQLSSAGHEVHEVHGGI